MINTRKSHRAAAVFGLSATILAGCQTASVGSDGLYAKPIGNAPVTANPSPYSAALACVAEYSMRYKLRAPRIAVGRVSDMTGQLQDNGGRAVTQGATLMAMTALGKAGVPLVERYETDVSKLEYVLADNRLISDAPKDAAGRRPYRPVLTGQMSGTDYFLTGGITELNTNIRTSQAEVSGVRGGSNAKVGGVSGSTYVMNIAIDLRLVDTQTLDVVDLVSYQKQIIGRQVGVGLYAFFGDNVVNVSAGSNGEEPVHLAVRSLVERAVFEMVTRVYGEQTRACLSPGADVLQASVVMPGGWATPQAAAPRPARPALASIAPPVASESVPYWVRQRSR